MEVEPEEGGAHPSLGEEGPDHGDAHNELQRRAARRVERWRELPVDGGGEEEEGEQPMPSPESHCKFTN